MELSPSVFSILSHLIEEKAGLHYGLLDRELLQEKASARAMDAGFTSLLDYYYFLRYDAEGARELGELLETLVVNETYFFREWLSIQVLVDQFVVPWVAQGRRPRIWSAACSTGEEPLSLVMLLEDRGVLNKVEVVASDISPRVLAKAQSGRFSKRSVRQVPDAQLCARHITSDSNGWSVDPRLISSIHWKQKNLLAPSETFDRPFDLIICRNVLIYFADATVKKVLENLAASLVPDGALLVGVSESLLRYGSVFQGEEHGGAFLYRKGSFQ